MFIPSIGVKFGSQEILVSNFSDGNNVTVFFSKTSSDIVLVYFSISLYILQSIFDVVLFRSKICFIKIKSGVGILLLS